MDSFNSALFGSSAGGSSTSWWVWVLASYALVEVIFAVVVYKHWLPKLNRQVESPTIRQFEDHTLRHKLFERMLTRNERLCLALGVDMKPYFMKFLCNWFFLLPEDSHHDENGDPLACIKETGLPCKDDIDKVISWGYFNCDSKDMTEEWQQRELNKMYALIKDRHGLEPGPKYKQKLQPVQMTLEDLDIKYRPLATYLVFNICRAIFALLLYSYGFSHHVSSTGLPYWYRPAKKQETDETNQPLPFLFFHGIAPAGASFYIPMLLWGLATDENGNIDRPIFLFQNNCVSFALTNHAPTEKETTEGVWEAVDKHCGPGTEVSLLGHSFGTCLQTYMLHSSQGHRVRQMVLMDPVSILLSDPDVITNFVYCRSHHRDTKLHDSVTVPGAAGWVMNELFIEHFLRRLFRWYNGELFLEDIPEHCKIVVCLSDGDEILNAQKVRAHVDIYNGNTPTIPRDMLYLREDGDGSPTPADANTKTDNPSISRGESVLTSASSASLESAGRQKLDMIYWEGEGVGHGSCLFNPATWVQVRRKMWVQQQQIFKEKSL